MVAKRRRYCVQTGQDAGGQHRGRDDHQRRSYHPFSSRRATPCCESSIRAIPPGFTSKRLDLITLVLPPFISQARILVSLAAQQDKEIGDGTTSVVLIASALLQRANELIRNKIHPTTVITGYRLACKEACRFMVEQLSTKVDTLGKESLINVAKTSMSSKILAA